MSAYDDWLETPYQRAQAKLEREEDEIAACVKDFEHGDIGYTEIVEPEELALLIHSVLLALCIEGVPESIRNANAKELIWDFYHTVGRDYTEKFL